MVFCIKKFSSALCLVYGTGQNLTNVPGECSVTTDNSKAIFKVICKLSRIFEKDFLSILENIAATEATQCYNVFMKASISRYVKLSAKPTYFHFMLLCSLIYTFVSSTFDDFHCFTFAKISSLCLMAVYERCYKYLFVKSNDTENFASYCKRLNLSLQSEDCRCDLPIDHDHVRSLLASLQDVDCSSISLTDLEEQILNDSLNMVLFEGFPSEPDASTDMSCESNSSSDDEDHINRKMNLLYLEEHSFNVNRICEFCRRKCFTFLILYETEVLERINQSSLITD